MRALALPRRDWPLVVAGALLLVLAYPPFHLFAPSFVCLVPAALLLLDGQQDGRPLRRHVVQGFWFGLLSQGLVLYWIIVALWHFTPLSALGYVATVIPMGMFWAILFAAVGWVMRRTGVSLLLVLPVGWTALEWMIGHIPQIGFPWLGLGTSLTGYPMVVQIADVVGARGVTFLLVVANTALALAWIRRRERTVWLIPVAVGIGTLLATAYGAWRMRAVQLRPVGEIALIQPDVGFQDKWDSTLQDSIFTHLMTLSRRAIDSTSPDMVVWPEAAVPGWLDLRPSWDRAIAAQSRRAGIPLLIGGLALDVAQFRSGDSNYDYWNSAFLVTPDRGRLPQAYHKRYLVPITERVPFVNPRWFDLRFFGGFAVGRERPVFETPLGAVGVMICYESAFEDLTRAYRARGVDVLVNITNDAWFGNSSAPYQHFAHLVMRAIETRAGIARAANSGISGFVDPLGRPYTTTRLNELTFVSDTLVTSDARTLYVRLGDWVGLFSLVAAGALLAWAWRRAA